MIKMVPSRLPRILEIGIPPMWRDSLIRRLKGEAREVRVRVHAGLFSIWAVDHSPEETG